MCYKENNNTHISFKKKIVFLCAVFFQSRFASSKVFFESVLSYLVLAQSNNLGVNGRPCQWKDELLDEFGNC